MKRLFALCVAVAAVTLCVDSTAQAQNYVGGYQFGAGINSYGGCGGFGAIQLFNREQPPYFAQYPPVYYSHIVKRPYGISPYAAPAGIAPVELNTPVPVTITNPYIPSAVDAAAEKTSEAVEKPAPRTNDKATWLKNPHQFEAQVASR